jgi:hypothetical protein
MASSITLTIERVLMNSQKFKNQIKSGGEKKMKKLR